MSKPLDQNINLNIDPSRTPILYVDSVHIKSDQFGVVLDFAQQLGPSNQYTIVARMGMSKEHAKDMVEHLEALLRVDGTGATKRGIREWFVMFSERGDGTRPNPRDQADAQNALRSMRMRVENVQGLCPGCDHFVANPVRCHRLSFEEQVLRASQGNCSDAQVGGVDGTMQDGGFVPKNG